MFARNIPICACTRARSGRIHVTYTQHTRIIQGGAGHRCACTRAYTLYTYVTTCLSTRIASMRGCMRICSSSDVLYHIYVRQMRHISAAYFRVCMRIYTRAWLYKHTRIMIYTRVVCVYAHAKAQGTMAYTVHILNIHTSEKAKRAANAHAYARMITTYRHVATCMKPRNSARA